MGLFGFKSPSEKKKELLVAEANEFSLNLNKEKNLPAISTQLLLKPQEEAFVQTDSKLYETRAVSYHKSSGSGGAVRIAKGVYVGGSSRSGKSESVQELKPIDEGTLILTNKRFVFDGKNENRIIPLDKIISIDPHIDSIEISAENRTKSMWFTVPNCFIWIFTFQILIQVPDPHKLGEVHLTANFT
ncbi:MAG: hypothetical protein HYT08_00690 [Candidatus Levybacteria bacterium]|nr:hypothetical protein [Candidatus Levybacteria bacterium]